MANLVKKPSKRIPITEYRSQGIRHVLGMSGAVTTASILAGLGAGPLAIPIYVGMGWNLFKGVFRERRMDWCAARDELMQYRFPGKPSLLDRYPKLREEWGEAVDELIEEMIGGCEIYNFTKDPNHPYYGMWNVLCFDESDDDLPPLTPLDYVEVRLARIATLAERASAIDVYARPSTEEPVPALSPIPDPEPVPTTTPTTSTSVVPVTDVSPIEELEQGGETPPTPEAEVPGDGMVEDADLFESVAPSAPPPARKPKTPASQSVVSFLLSLTQAPLQPVLVAGQPGAGKGGMTAMALTLGVRHNKARFWVFNCKSKLSEAGYWIGAEKHYLKNALKSDPDLFLDLMSVLEEFADEASRRNDGHGHHPPFILLLEEIGALVGLMTKAEKEQYRSKIISMATLLRGSNMAVWVSGASVTLEDLGISGRSNRAVFTALVAVGDQSREGTKEICQLIGVDYDESRLERGKRYWLTNGAAYEALPLPSSIPTFPTWADVPNVINLRPDQAQDDPQDDGLTLGDLFDADEFPKQVPLVREMLIPELVDDAGQEETSESAFSNELQYRFFRYLDDRYGSLAIKDVKDWARGFGMNAAQVDELLIAMKANGIVDIDPPKGRRGAWVHLIPQPR